jgi:hypothetical protein
MRLVAPSARISASAAATRTGDGGLIVDIGSP